MPSRPRHRASRAALLLSVLSLIAASEIGCSDDAPQTVVAIDLVEEARWTRSFAALENDKPASETPQSVGARQVLTLEAGAEIEFFLRLPEASWLVVDHVTTRGSSNGTVLVDFRREAGESVQMKMTPAADRSRIHLALPGGKRQLARLVISSPEADDAEGLIALWAPRIETPAETRAEITPPAATSVDSGGDGASVEISGKTRPNLIIYLVDTLRRDRLGVYGSTRNLTPNFDRFAEVATVYRRAVAQSSWTRPSVASIFTGLEPHVHGVNDKDSALPDAARTLAEILKVNGYDTAAFITNGNVGPEFNFDQGFDVFSLPHGRKYLSDQVNVRLSEYLETRDSNKPLFLYVHTMDPHAPYTPTEPFRARFADSTEDPRAGEIEYLRQFRTGGKLPNESLKRDVTDLYAAEVAFNDEFFGEFLDLLKQHDLLDGSWIALTSDHGEEFWDHGSWSHGQSLFGELIDIPLLIKKPESSEYATTDRLAQHIDLFATALDYAGVAEGSGHYGWSLRREPESGAPVNVFSTVNLNKNQGSSVIEGDWKLIMPQPRILVTKPQLFNLHRDPGETKNLYALRPIRAGYLEALLRRHESKAGLKIGSSTGEMNEELLRELKALGYID